MQEERQTLIADFTIEGRLAYLSHQETLTLFQRSLLRAGVPVIFSEGFNPRPRLSVPLPRSVGTQSRVERICVFLSAAADREVNAADLKSRLEKCLPEHCTLLNVQCRAGKVCFCASGTSYVFTSAKPFDEDHRRHLAACQSDLEAGRPIEVQRYQAKKKIRRPFVLSPFVEYLRFSDNTIEVSCRIRQEGTVRVDELMQWLRLELGQLREPVKRTKIQWI